MIVTGDWFRLEKKSRDSLKGISGFTDRREPLDLRYLSLSTSSFVLELSGRGGRTWVRRSGGSVLGVVVVLDARDVVGA